jgi:hypothetical protein
MLREGEREGDGALRGLGIVDRNEDVAERVHVGFTKLAPTASLRNGFERDLQAAHRTRSDGSSDEPTGVGCTDLHSLGCS